MLTNAQFYIAIGVPTFTVLVTWLGTTISNRSALSDFRAEMYRAIDGVAGETKGFRNEIKDLRAEMTRRFDVLEAKIDKLDDARINHEQRITKLEERILLRPAR
jgi:peptidoglycan hydrolase CwlO-like protein